MTAHIRKQGNRQADAAFAVAALLGVALLAWLVITMQQLAHDLRQANDARDALAHQVQQLGGTPVAGAPGSRGGIGPSGPPGPTGPTGPAGIPGTDGSPGPSGASGPVGPIGSPGVTGTSGPVGASGVDGVAGSPGSAGPQGNPGPAGPAGPAGSDGTDGKDGKDGKDGADGQPPAGWTYTDATGQSYTCTPASGFDPATPRYACTADTPPPIAPSSRKGLLGVGMLASSAMYRRVR